MGQACDAKHLTNLIGELDLGATQHQSSQDAAPPRPHDLGQPLSKMASQISQRGPWTLQNLDALDPQLTPTALASQTFGRTRQ